MSTRGPDPTDVSDEEWAFVAPSLTFLPEDARQRTLAWTALFRRLAHDYGAPNWAA
jgi:hypothetical protein